MTTVYMCNTQCCKFNDGRKCTADEIEIDDIGECVTAELEG